MNGYGSLKGRFTTSPDIDLTKPILEQVQRRVITPAMVEAGEIAILESSCSMN